MASWRAAGLCLCLLLCACERAPPAATDRSGPGAAQSTQPTNETARALRAITEEYYDAWLVLNPLAATAQGDHRFDDRFGDYVSLAWMADSLAIEQQALEELAVIDPSQLDGEDLLTYEAFDFDRRINIEGFRYPSELLPVHQLAAIPVEFALLGSGRGVHPFRNARDYDNFLGRMDGFVTWVDQAIANMRSGVERGVVQPRVVVERTLPQLEAIAVDDAARSVFWQPLLAFPAGLTVAERQRLVVAYRAKIDSQVLPAYRRLHEYLATEYLPQARKSVGLAELPNGASWYAYLARRYTTTTLTPDAIHELGQREVARIRGEMERAMRALGATGDPAGFLAALRTDPRFHPADADALLAGYRALRGRVGAALPHLFARSPKADFEIRAVEGFRAASAASASYVPAGEDGRRPGVFYVNTHDLPSRPTYLMEALFLHEAVPGHHFQIATAQEALGLPRVRRFAWDAAYGEGWALYAESLGADLGLYTDPYMAFGALTTGIWRAARLVVDTGLHSRNWTRARAVAYLRANTALGDADIAAEVDRYIARPGQALAYKIGELEIRELRRRAQQRLGPRFDLRAFHAQVLESGSLPLPVLEAKVDRWIARQ